MNMMQELESQIEEMKDKEGNITLPAFTIRMMLSSAFSEGGKVEESRPVSRGEKYTLLIVAIAIFILGINIGSL